MCLASLQTKRYRTNLPSQRTEDNSGVWAILKYRRQRLLESLGNRNSTTGWDKQLVYDWLSSCALPSGGIF